MIIRPFEIWKARPPGFETSHWFVIVSSPERCADSRLISLNGLACFTLRGDMRPTDVRLNGADGFDHPTVVGCDFLFVLAKSGLLERKGVVTVERQRIIKARLREVLRLS
jgi:hypothetical protein